MSIQMYVDKLLRARTKEDAFSALTDFLTPLFPRSAVFLARKEENRIQGLMVHGFAVHARVFREMVVPWQDETVLRRVLESGDPFFGTVPVKPADAKWVSALQIPSRWPVNAHPIEFRGKNVAVYLGLPELVESDRSRQDDIIQLACYKAGLGLEFGALRRMISETPK
jgi:hypothetical protein